MSCIKKKIRHICSQLPRGGCGLKYVGHILPPMGAESASARGLWIEILMLSSTDISPKSASARGLWIEMYPKVIESKYCTVSFREGAVD